MNSNQSTKTNPVCKFPKYSVLMAVYIKDNPDWFALAIDSMLKQTIVPNEVVIVEDGLITDELKEVIRERQVRYPNLIRSISLEHNKGLGEALRIGILQCKNEWIARMDADDYAYPQRCERQFWAAEHEGADIVGCDVNEFVGMPDCVVATRVFPEKHEEIYKFAKRRTPFAHPAVIFKRSQVLEAGNYQSAYLHEDFDLFVRMLASGYRGYTVKKALVAVRVSNDFYMRRGGWVYLKALLLFNRKQYKNGWMSWTDFLIRSSANIVSCLVPNMLRDWIYRRLLRK